VRDGHRPDRDLDLAVVLNGQRGDFIDTKLDMAGIAFGVPMETGVLVLPFPMREGADISQGSPSCWAIG
jgi:hypothetical protein